MRKSSIERKLDEERNKTKKTRTSRYKSSPVKKAKKDKTSSTKTSKIKDFDIDEDDEVINSLDIIDDQIENDDIEDEVYKVSNIKEVVDEDEEDDDDDDFELEDDFDDYEDEEDKDAEEDASNDVGETIVFNYDELNEMLESKKMGRSKGKRNNKKAKVKEEKTKYTAGDKIKMIFTHLIRLGALGIIVGMVLMYGPYSGFREWWISTAMTTMTHKYLATWFFDDLTIQDALNKNKVVESNESTNTDLITGETAQTTNYANEYERQILERDPKNNDYKIIPINGKGYSGYLTAVYEPQRIHAVATAKLGVSGQYVVEMAEANDALIAINGGGFNDPNFNSTGGSPLGITISRGKFVTQNSYNGSGGLIGFDEKNNFICGKMTVTQAKNAGIRDAVTFGPFLIVNGKSSSVLGNGGWGDAPRTAIGQRADGIVLFLVLDGRTATNLGADMDDLIEVMERYGAINAANLDGGTSSVLVVNNTIVNDPIDSSGAHKTRPISTAFIVDKDDSDDSDHTLVKSKLE